MKQVEEITAILQAVNAGDEKAYDQLMRRIHGELRRVAGALMRSEKSGHTLQPTALVNEAYLRLAGGDSQWENRAHFFGAAARAMRRILVEYARRRSAEKRGGDAQQVTFSDLHVEVSDPDIDLLALDEAMKALGEEDERLVKVVELRFFAGCSVKETARILGVSAPTVKRDWAFARAWLYDYMK